jgi:hypothetical protein
MVLLFRIVGLSGRRSLLECGAFAGADSYCGRRDTTRKLVRPLLSGDKMRPAWLTKDELWKVD